MITDRDPGDETSHDPFVRVLAKADARTSARASEQSYARGAQFVDTLEARQHELRRLGPVADTLPRASDALEAQVSAAMALLDRHPLQVHQRQHHQGMRHAA